MLIADVCGSPFDTFNNFCSNFKSNQWNVRFLIFAVRQRISEKKKSDGETKSNQYVLKLIMWITAKNLWALKPWYSSSGWMILRLCGVYVLGTRCFAMGSITACGFMQIRFKRKISTLIRCQQLRDQLPVTLMRCHLSSYRCTEHTLPIVTSWHLKMCTWFFHSLVFFSQRHDIFFTWTSTPTLFGHLLFFV